MPNLCESCGFLVGACRLCFYTCSQAICCRKPPVSRPEFAAVCLGLSNVGKTTILTNLCGEDESSIVPTVGFSIKAVGFNDAILNIKELGGAENIRQYWNRYYDGAEAVVFVIDSASAEDNMQQIADEMKAALCHNHLKGLPLLVLAHCQDKDGARGIEEITELLDLEMIGEGRQWIVHASSINDNSTIRGGFTKLIHLLLGTDEVDSNRI
ncbi:ADP-ribosylation factor-like protein 15 [Anneissia japonica]|uniref:ADP-ribosylation factor-like protein 15 n=1 Tax=Anneissia japonica TaxID=1529436 RepID=UPI0014257FC7|nr:ADP-ribosylation factor-like protein 15 [Anneissia japonica]